jgi:hypothetical protein
VSPAATAFELEKWGEGVVAPFPPCPLSSPDPSRARVHATWSLELRRVRDSAMVLSSPNHLTEEE